MQINWNNKLNRPWQGVHRIHVRISTRYSLDSHWRILFLRDCARSTLNQKRIMNQEVWVKPIGVKAWMMLCIRSKSKPQMQFRSFYRSSASLKQVLAEFLTLWLKINFTLIRTYTGNSSNPWSLVTVENVAIRLYLSVAGCDASTC